LDSRVFPIRNTHVAMRVRMSGKIITNDPEMANPNIFK
jgi:hypothetical protein